MGTDRDLDFAAYVAARGQRLTRSAVLLGLSPHDAEDLAQTALTRCYVSWSKVRAAEDVDAYVYRVMVNCLLTDRRRKWTGETPTDDVGPGAEPDKTEHVAVGVSVRAALRDMSFDHRSVLVLRFFADLTDRQVADVLAIPVGTVKSRLSRALAQLSDHPRLIGLADKETAP